jgi:uncharacterized membrane protein YgcG
MGIVWVMLGLVALNLILFGRLYYVSRRSTKSKVTRHIVVALGFIFAFFPIIGTLLIFILFAVLGKGRTVPDQGNYDYAMASGSSWDSSDSSSSSDSDFDGGGGGDSGGGGSDSDW